MIAPGLQSKNLLMMSKINSSLTLLVLNVEKLPKLDDEFGL